MRRVGNAECRKCGVKEMRSVENVECGKRGVLKMRSVENAEFSHETLRKHTYVIECVSP